VTGGEADADPQFWADESGATAIEYTLICGIMTVALVAVAGVGGALDEIYEEMRQIIDALRGGARKLRAEFC
jgi:Flp pilus assembly pilin Flp